MTNQIAQKFIDLLGPITDSRTHFATFSDTTMGGGHYVTEMSKVQRELAEQILKDHFRFKQVKWIKASGGSYDGKAITVSTRKLADNDFTTYEGKTAYVYQIMFSSKMYDPNPHIKHPVKDGCTFGPLVYNPENFEPSRTISITYNPTYALDFPFNNSEEGMKQTLRDQLEKVLANPEDYMPEGLRVCMVRMAVV